MQNMKKQNIILGITGASGAIYAKLLLEELEKQKDNIENLAVLISDNARKVWEYELSKKPEFPGFAQFYEKNDFQAPFASGSSDYGTMIICPCSMGTLGRIANGVSDDLLTRAADVILKEKRNLVVVPRETPFSLIHLRNLTGLHEAGATIIPAIPSFYSKPATIEELALTVIHRVLSHSGFYSGGFRWGEE